MKRIKKIKNWFKRNKKVIAVVLLMLVAISIVSSLNSEVFAKITHEEDSQESVTDEVASLFGGVLKTVLNVGVGALTGPVATMLTALSLIVFLVLYLIFAAVGVNNGILSFPFPDQVVFNKMAFFDPNFINPTQASNGSAPVALLQSTISSIYYTFFIIALSVFVIAAMIIGIKLAISSIASEKAQYKEALNNWIFGIILLFTVHFLMGGIFALNETIVEVASDVSGTIKFTYNTLESIPVAGNAISKFVGSAVDAINDFFGSDIPTGVFVEIPFGGYTGLILMFVIKAEGGDLVSSLILFIILGQTVALVVMYTKRLFYCIFLGMMAPLIVAADVIQKSIQ